MALDYEVRAEYKSLSLSKLLDAPVMCFEGVGDTQDDMLSRYFGITTVRQLANMPYFLWSLGIQERALRRGESVNKSVGDLSKEEELKFSVRDNAQGKNSRELLNAPLNVLEGLTPGQNLALYDAFRITNVIQLAHNRIMLEARVIEYMEKHGDELDPSAPTEKSEIASILGADTLVPSSGVEAQATLAGGETEQEVDGLQKMASELGEHLRGRIDALKERAVERAQDLTSSEAKLAMEGAGETSAAPEEEQAKATIEAGGRGDALQMIRERTEATRIQRISRQPGAASPADRAAEITAGRAGVAGEEAGAEMHVAPVESADVVGETDEMEEMEQPAAAEGIVEAPEEPAGKFQPWMAVAGLVFVILLVAIWFLLPAGEKEPPIAQAPPEVAQPTIEELAAEAEAARIAAEQAALALPEPEPEPGPPIRTIHKVTGGQSLWRISRLYYRRGALWPTIYDNNLEEIEDPDLIFPDQQFKIPE